MPVRNTTQQVLMALPCIVLFAMVSWHLIERQILSLRRRFSFVAAHRLQAGSEQPAGSRSTRETPPQPMVMTASTGAAGPLLGLATMRVTTTDFTALSLTASVEVDV